MKKICGVLAISILGTLAGCSSVPLTTSASKVIVSPNAPAKNCRYIGQVVGNQGNFFTGGFTSNSTLEEGSMNDLRNKASAMGANYVQLLTSRAGNTGSVNSFGGEVFGGSQQTNVTNLGNAYLCPRAK